jgi:hypothetical protein
MTKQSRIALAMAVGAVLLPANLVSAQWGDLKMKFVVDGKAPVMPKLKVEKDAAVCNAPGTAPLLSEQFVVGKEGGVKNIVVYLVADKGAPKVHDSYDKDKGATVQLDNKGCRFVPHVSLLRIGQTLVLKNSDSVGHNSKLDFLANLPKNPTLPAMSEQPIKPAEIAKPEKRAVSVSCSIHPWMSGYVIVQDHPYMAVSDEDGILVIKNLPEDKHSFQIWHETGYLTLTSGKLKPVKGKVDIEIKPEMSDLVEFKVKPKSK